MALKYPAFRKNFPLLVTGSLLALQPLAASFAVAAEQFDCQASASGGWACAPSGSNTEAAPPRPVHSVAPGTGSQRARDSSAAGESRTTWWRWSQTLGFPEPIRFGRSVRWNPDAVDSFLTQQGS